MSNNPEDLMQRYSDHQLGKVDKKKEPQSHTELVDKLVEEGVGTPVHIKGRHQRLPKSPKKTEKKVAGLCIPISIGKSQAKYIYLDKGGNGFVFSGDEFMAKAKLLARHSLNDRETFFSELNSKSNGFQVLQQESDDPEGFMQEVIGAIRSIRQSKEESKDAAGDALGTLFPED